MALPSITTKVSGSDTVAERKVLVGDINQIKQALQTGALDIKPLDVKMSGTNMYFNDDTVGVRYNTGTNKIQFSNDGSSWSDIGGDTTLNTTVTAGEDLAIRDLVYFNSSDGKVYKCDSDDNTKIDWVGVMSEAVLTDASGTMYTNSAIVGGFTGLTPGASYYVSGTAGEISSTGAYKVGFALTATQVKLVKEPNDWALIETLSPAATGSVSTSVSLTPYNEFKVEFTALVGAGDYGNFMFNIDNATASNWANIQYYNAAPSESTGDTYCQLCSNGTFGMAAIVYSGTYYMYSGASTFVVHGTSGASLTNKGTLLRARNDAVTSKASQFTFTTDDPVQSTTATFSSGTVIRIYAR